MQRWPTSGIVNPQFGRRIAFFDRKGQRRICMRGLDHCIMPSTDTGKRKRSKVKLRRISDAGSAVSVVEPIAALSRAQQHNDVAVADLSWKMHSCTASIHLRSQATSLVKLLGKHSRCSHFCYVHLGPKYCEALNLYVCKAFLLRPVSHESVIADTPC